MAIIRLQIWFMSISAVALILCGEYFRILQASQCVCEHKVVASRETVLPALRFDPSILKPNGLNKTFDYASENYIFLQGTDEQFNAGKYTLYDFVYLAALSSRRPVMPFIGRSHSAFVGLPLTKDPLFSSTGESADEILDMKFPVADWARFDEAFNSCKHRTRIVTIFYAHLGEDCSMFSGIKLHLLGLWGARDIDCLDSMKLDIQYFENTTDCIVLHRFHGLRAGTRGKILWEHSTKASLRHQIWSHREEVLRNNYFYIQKTPFVHPKPDYLMDSVACNMNLWGSVYDVLQYRAEFICIHLNEGALKGLDQNMTQFSEMCVNNTIHELVQLRDPGSQVPIILMHDLSKTGSFGVTDSCRSIFPVSKLADIVRSYIANVTLFFSTECDVFENCTGPACFFLDMAIFLQARHAVQLGITSSSQALRAPRINAGRITTNLDPTSYENMSCPCRKMVM